MATVKICDRCGAEINPRKSITYAQLRNYNLDRQSETELCCSCAMHLREWLEPVTQKEGADHAT